MIPLARGGGGYQYWLVNIGAKYKNIPNAKRTSASQFRGGGFVEHPQQFSVGGLHSLRGQ